MANSSTLSIRRAMLIAMKADTDLVALVPAARLYGQTVAANPTYPLIRCGSPSSVPVRAACVDGADTIVAVHAFAKPRLNGSGQVIETAEDFAARIGAAIATALDGQAPAIPGGKARFIWTGDQLLQDTEEADCFHTVQNFRVRAITA